MQSVLNPKMSGHLTTVSFWRKWYVGFFSYNSQALDLLIVTAATTVANDIVTSLNEKQHYAALFVDLAKAFDSKKLLFIGFDDSAYN